MGDDDTVTGLVIRAQNGDQAAWDALVERYSPLVWSICRRYGLDRADAEDVGQTVWSRLVNQLGNLRDPAALPGWLATTTQRECCQALRTVRSSRITAWLPDAENIPDSRSRTAEEDLLTAERHAALREAFTSLSPFCQELMALLIQDPPVPYAQISAKLDIPVGSIGPARRRCLEKLRRHPAIVALMNDDDDDGPAARGERRNGDGEHQVGSTAEDPGEHPGDGEPAYQQIRLVPGGEPAEQVGHDGGGRADREPRCDQLGDVRDPGAQERREALAGVEAEGTRGEDHDHDQPHY
jgi:RNA polymerase sigma factor (sigma-70 family)